MAPTATSLTYNNDINDSHETPPKSVAAAETVAKQKVFDIMSNRVSYVDIDTCQVGSADAFIVADMGEVYRKHMAWKRYLGRVKPHYAVKCAPDFQVLSLLAEMGTGFDCASIGEIETVLNLGVDPSRIIYANPAKQADHLRTAYALGVMQTVFDNEDELVKISRHAPHAEVFLRIMVDDTSSLCRLSQKYGAPLDTTAELLDLAKRLDVNLVGVSFHCGSGVSDPSAFTKAVEDARTVFNQAREAGFDLKVLDVGGGFTGDGFESMANTLKNALDDNFPNNIRVIGEPGRYYVSSAFTVACQVIGRRAEKDPFTGEKRYKLYVNDGVYGNFASLIFDHQHVKPRILSKRSPSTEATNYSIWGQTCDGLDKINDKVTLPGELKIGDWLYFEEMGAYTICCATAFNGFTNKHNILYMSSEDGASALLGYHQGYDQEDQDRITNLSYEDVYPDTPVSEVASLGNGEQRLAFLREKAQEQAAQSAVQGRAKPQHNVSIICRANRQLFQTLPQ